MKKESDSISFSSALAVTSTLNSISSLIKALTTIALGRNYKGFNVELLGH